MVESWPDETNEQNLNNARQPWSVITLRLRSLIQKRAGRWVGQIIESGNVKFIRDAHG